MRRACDGTQGIPPHFPDTRVHAGIHADKACTFSSGLMPYALMHSLQKHRILGGGMWRACLGYGSAYRDLEDAYVLACTQACTPMHWHALSPVPYALCITISSSFG